MGEGMQKEQGTRSKRKVWTVWMKSMDDEVKKVWIYDYEGVVGQKPFYDIHTLRIVKLRRQGLHYLSPDTL